jgi:alpha-glucosidase (family GH31 glycosyl hydrolase)
MYSAVWTGDNQASFEHMRGSVHMLLSMSVAGLSFVGADIGGFENSPS